MPQEITSLFPSHSGQFAGCLRAHHSLQNQRLIPFVYSGGINDLAFLEHFQISGFSIHSVIHSLKYLLNIHSV